MDHKKFLTIILSFWSVILFAQTQEVISSAGNSFESSSGSISFTIGECMTSTFSSPGSMITQGFHQTKLTIVDNITLNNLLEYDISVFPNPVEENLTLRIDIPQGFQYMLYDLKGVLLERSQLISTETELDFKNLNPSIYILKVFKSTEEVRTFKIIKH